MQVGGAGTRPALVVIEGVTPCDEVPAPPAECSSKVCRLIHKALQTRCTLRSAIVALAARPAKVPGALVVTRTFKKKVRSAGPVQGRLRLNKLGRSLLQQSRSLPLEARAEIRDRGGSTLSALFRTLLRSR